MAGFSSASLFPVRKREAVAQGGTRRIVHPTRRRTHGAGIVKGRRTNETAGAFQINLRKIRKTQARAP